MQIASNIKLQCLSSKIKFESELKTSLKNPGSAFIQDVQLRMAVELGSFRIDLKKILKLNTCVDHSSMN